MARIFITGSADGLGQLSAALLVAQGHHVVLHARNTERAKEAMRKTPGAEQVLTADLSSIEASKELAEKVNALGSFDAVVHNAGVYRASSKELLTVNTVAPYILTFSIHRPNRLIYLSSGLHLQGRPNLEQLDRVSYSDTKLHDTMLTLAVARKWPDVYSNAVNPGWVPTRMGGKGAPDDLHKGCETQSWLATSDDAEARVSGRYFFHLKQKNYNPVADDTTLQDRLLQRLSEMTGVKFTN